MEGQIWYSPSNLDIVWFLLTLASSARGMPCPEYDYGR